MQAFPIVEGFEAIEHQCPRPCGLTKSSSSGGHLRRGALMEVPLRLPAVACFALLVTPLGAWAQTFNFTFDRFRTVLDAKIREDMTDKAQADASTTRTCKTDKNVHTCTFNGAGFQAMSLISSVRT